MSALTDAHIEAQRRLRVMVAQAVGTAWTSLPAYDEEQVPTFTATAASVVVAGQRQSVALTNAYLARALGRQPLPLDTPAIIAALRGDATPGEVYRRPFVTVWTALKAGSEFEAAVAAGLARATSTASMDVQMAMRAASNAVQAADDRIYGFQRAADPGACSYCSMLDGAYVKSADAMPMHNGCGCGLEPLTAPHPRAASLPDGVAVHEHGELGPVLGDPAHSFDSL